MEFQLLIDFIKGLYPGKDTIVLHEPQFIGNEKKYLLDCIDSTYVSSVGKYVTMFEEKMAEFLSLPDNRYPIPDTFSKFPIYCVAAVNGTSALHLALQVAGVKQGDQVITQPLTFIATANAIRYAGADPIFVDVDRDTLGMSPKSLLEFLEKNISKGKKEHGRIAAIVPMHTFGLPCRISEIVEIGKKFGIPVIEDAAESIGSYYKGQHTGSYGLIGIMSFNGNKTITTGGGGMLVTRDADLAKHLKHLTTQAKIPHPWEFKHDETGYNYRMPNINAALGVAQLEILVGDKNLETGHRKQETSMEKMRVMGFLEAKRDLAHRYMEFCVNNNIEFVQEPEYSTSNYWLNSILLKNIEERNAFLHYAFDQHVYCRPAWELMHRLPMFSSCERNNLSNAEWIADRLLNLPSSPVI